MIIYLTCITLYLKVIFFFSDNHLNFSAFKYGFLTVIEIISCCPLVFLNLLIISFVYKHSSFLLEFEPNECYHSALCALPVYLSGGCNSGVTPWAIHVFLCSVK